MRANLVHNISFKPFKSLSYAFGDLLELKTFQKIFFSKFAYINEIFIFTARIKFNDCSRVKYFMRLKFRKLLHNSQIRNSDLGSFEIIKLFH